MEFCPAGPSAPDSIWVDWYRMLEVLTDRAELDVGVHKNGRGQHDLKELGYQLPVQSRSEYLVGYEPHVYGDHSLIVFVVEQMEGALARALQCMPLSMSLDNLIRRLETEISNKGS
ncbi:hypothetical protein VDGL01_12089 [Verticillium dahliae]